MTAVSQGGPVTLKLLAESQFYNLVFSFSFVPVSLLRAYRFFNAGCLPLLADSLSWKTISLSYTMKQELERPQGNLEGIDNIGF